MKAATWPTMAGTLMLLLTAGGPLLAGETLTLASGRSDAPVHTAGVGLSSLIKFQLLPSKKIDLHVLETAGAVDNVRLLQSGEADLAILPSAVGHAARLGVGSFDGDRPETGFRAIATLWRDALHLVVRDEDVVTGTVDDLLKLEDRQLFTGEAASGMVDANRLLLADLGVETDHAGQHPSVVDGDGISAIRRGEVDGFSVTARPPDRMFDAIFDGTASGLRLLDVTESQMNRANGNHWLWTPYVIPAGTYPGQKEDIWTIALSNLLVVRADVDPDVVYAITKSMFENLDYLGRIDPLMADLGLETALAGMAMPLHPGALRYYDQAGLIPRAVSDDDAVSPGMTPVRQKDERPGSMPERYPDADVAGDWPTGAGGPLLRTTKPDGEPAATSTRPAPRKPPEPHWRRRATL